MNGWAPINLITLGGFYMVWDHYGIRFYIQDAFQRLACLSSVYSSSICIYIGHSEIRFYTIWDTVLPWSKQQAAIQMCYHDNHSDYMFENEAKRSKLFDHKDIKRTNLQQTKGIVQTLVYEVISQK